MKTTKKTPKTTKSVSQSVPPSPCVIPRISHAKANQEFIASQKETPKSEGKNDYVEAFVTVMSNVCDNLRSFTLSDVRYYAKFKNIEPVQAEKLFGQWVSKMQEWKKIEVINGAYDEPVYLMV